MPERRRANPRQDLNSCMGQGDKVWTTLSLSQLCSLACCVSSFPIDACWERETKRKGSFACSFHRDWKFKWSSGESQEFSPLLVSFDAVKKSANLISPDSCAKCLLWGSRPALADAEGRLWPSSDCVRVWRRQTGYWWEGSREFWGNICFFIIFIVYGFLRFSPFWYNFQFCLYVCSCWETHNQAIHLTGRLHGGISFPWLGWREEECSLSASGHHVQFSHNFLKLLTWSSQEYQPKPSTVISRS